MKPLEDLLDRAKLKLSIPFQDVRTANNRRYSLWEESGAWRAKQEAEKAAYNRHKMRAKGLAYKARQDMYRQRAEGTDWYLLLGNNEKQRVKARETARVLLNASDAASESGYTAAKQEVEDSIGFRRLLRERTYR